VTTDASVGCRATLTVMSQSLSVAELEAKVGLTPDWSAEKGSPVSKGAVTLHKYTTLGFVSTVDRYAAPAAHIDSVLGRVEVQQDAVRALAGGDHPADARGVPVRLSVHLETEGEMFGFDVSARQLAALSNLGAHFGVEVVASAGP
jgi:hypothetical protein